MVLLCTAGLGVARVLGFLGGGYTTKEFEHVLSWWFVFEVVLRLNSVE